MSPAAPAAPAADPPSRRRRALLAAPWGTALPWGAAAAETRKVLRVPFNFAETSFDPARIIDLASRTITPHIFEALYTYDHLARPVKFRPLTAQGMPEASADFRVWTVRVRPGIYFADDPAFKGQRRELVARDFLYAFQRVVDPANNSPASSTVLDEKIIGLAALRRAALQARKPFDYDAPIAGIQVLDRYTLRFTVEEPRPRFIQNLAAGDLLGAQAREVVEFYGDKIGEHPVGTGPFVLARDQWVRGSRIVLLRNPGFREMVYDAEPAPGDAEGQAILARFKGRRLPMVDAVEVRVINETQPLWLSFLNGEIDALVTEMGSVPTEFAPQALPNGRLAPNLAKRGIQAHRTMRSDVAEAYFNMDDPVVGGYTPDRVALRRAISLGYDVGREIRLIRRGQAVPAQSPIVPGTTGYDPAFKSEMSDYDPARANALLDLYGYADRDGDGWRETLDGKPLLLRMSTEPEQIYRQYNELFRRCMQAIGLRCEFETAQWPEHMKAALAGKLQMWMLGSSADVPDGQSALARYYGPQAGNQNLARFKLDAFDRVYERLQVLPDGAERERLFREAKRLAVAYMPYKVLAHRVSNELVHPWVAGYRKPIFWQDWWHLVDVDPNRRSAA
jgi:ABC-type transport system substrate-binding protein